MYYSKFILTEQTAGSYWSPPILGKYTACMWQRALQGNGENEQTNYVQNLRTGDIKPFTQNMGSTQHEMAKDEQCSSHYESRLLSVVLAVK